MSAAQGVRRAIAEACDAARRGDMVALGMALERAKTAAHEPEPEPADDPPFIVFEGDLVRAEFESGVPGCFGESPPPTLRGRITGGANLFVEFCTSPAARRVAELREVTAQNSRYRVTIEKVKK